MIPDHIQRVIDEADALLIKATSLVEFEKSAIFPTLPEEEQHLLALQRNTMFTYLMILNRRLVLHKAA